MSPLELLAGRHPIRPRILRAIATAGELAPAELARDLGADLPVVAYHVRRLRDEGGLEAARQRQVRGAVQTFYRVTLEGRAIIDPSPLVLAVDALEAIADGVPRPRVLAEHALQALGRRPVA